MSTKQTAVDDFDYPKFCDKLLFSAAFSHGVAVFLTVTFPTVFAFLFGIPQSNNNNGFHESFNDPVYIRLLIHTLIPFVYFVFFKTRFPDLRKPKSDSYRKYDYGVGIMVLFSLIYVYAYNIMKENFMAVMGLTAVLSVVLSCVKLFASTEDSLNLSCWFMAASIVSGYSLIFSGYWKAAVWALYPAVLVLVSTVATQVWFYSWFFVTYELNKLIVLIILF